MITDQSGKTLIYDAWNRVVRVKNGDVTLITHTYDTLNRRISENSGTTRELYYSSAWQIVEERENGLAVVQNVWSPVYVDALILRDRDVDSNGTLEERLYAQHDANYDITSLVSASGVILERFLQDPYGSFSILAADWSARVASLYVWLHLLQGGRYEPVAGQFHFRHRWLMPALGRWQRMDPVCFQVGDTNRYRYLRNSPVNLSDPLGLQSILIGSPAIAPRPVIQPPTSPFPRIYVPPPQPFQPPPPVPPPLINPPTGSREPAPIGPNPRDFPADNPQRLPWRYPECDGRPNSDCPPDRYEDLRWRVNHLCHNPPPPPCTSGFLIFWSCAGLRDAERKNEDCARARRRIMYECFRGGDQGHRIQLAQIEYQISYCNYRMRLKGCFDDPFSPLNPGPMA